MNVLHKSNHLMELTTGTRCNENNNHITNNDPPDRTKHRPSWLRGTIQLSLSLYLIWKLWSGSVSDPVDLLMLFVVIAQGILSFGLHQTDVSKPFFRFFDNLCIPLHIATQNSSAILHTMRRTSQTLSTSPTSLQTIKWVWVMTFFSCFMCSSVGSQHIIFKLSILAVMIPPMFWLCAGQGQNGSPYRLLMISIFVIHIIGFLYFMFEYIVDFDPTERPIVVFDRNAPLFGNHEMTHVCHVIGDLMAYSLCV